jgi:glycosyltransferase involved in cell wall biosynthesis
MPQETVALGRRIGVELGARALFLTPHVDQAIRAGAAPDWADVKSAPPSEVPNWLRRGRAVFFLYRPGRHVRATSPTRLGEALASGLPVVTNEGIGDVDGLIETGKVGVLLRGLSDGAFGEAARQLKALLAEDGIEQRCRRVAESHLGVELGVGRYLDLYGMVASRGRSR